LEKAHATIEVVEKDKKKAVAVGEITRSPGLDGDKF
jgi:hypothetical protein